jgi:DNA-binding CsgD family transcriptional regulator
VTCLNISSERADDMTIVENLLHRSVTPPNAKFRGSEGRAAADPGRELRGRRSAEFQLKEALAREGVLRRQIDQLIGQQEALGKLLAGREDAAKRVETLTPREHQILDLVLAGCPSKNIAADLHINIRTVENHRNSIMKKTGSKSLPALARLALAATWNHAGKAFARTGFPIATAR